MNVASLTASGKSEWGEAARQALPSSTAPEPSEGGPSSHSKRYGSLRKRFESANKFRK